MKVESEVEGEVAEYVGAGCVVSACFAKAFDKPNLVGVSARPAVAVACAYDIGWVTEGRAAAGTGFFGKMRVVAAAAAMGSVCVVESVLVAATMAVCEAVLVVATTVCIAALETTGTV